MKILLYLVFTAFIALLPSQSFAGGIGVSPGDMKIEDILKVLNDQNLPDLDLFIKQFNSPSGTDLILKFKDWENLQNAGNFDVLGVDPATFVNLNQALENTSHLNSLQVEDLNNSLPVSAIHSDTAGRFMVLETDKTFDAFAKDILIAPVLGQ